MNGIDPDCKPLPREFYDRDPAAVARELLGKRLIRASEEGLTAGRIVEVEAYLAEGDAASHSHRGLKRRNASMFGPPGCAYVYSIHARWCVNAVTESEGVGSAVLIRAVEPLEGLALMRQRRGMDEPRMLTRGPARLCEAFAIDKELDGWDLTRGRRLWIVEDDSLRPGDIEIATSPRIGVSGAEDLPLRFSAVGNQFVSRNRRRRGAQVKHG